MFPNITLTADREKQDLNLCLSSVELWTPPAVPWQLPLRDVNFPRSTGLQKSETLHTSGSEAIFGISLCQLLSHQTPSHPQQLTATLVWIWVIWRVAGRKRKKKETKPWPARPDSGQEPDLGRNRELGHQVPPSTVEYISPAPNISKCNTPLLSLRSSWECLCSIFIALALRTVPKLSVPDLMITDVNTGRYFI